MICNTDVCKDGSADLKCKLNIKLALRLILFEEGLYRILKSVFRKLDIFYIGGLSIQ